MTIITMYDSDTAADIPEDAPAVAGYIVNSEAPPWTDADYARFTDATVKRRIVPTVVNDGDTLDIEKGDATVDQAAGWVAKRVAAGVAEADLWLYCQRSNFDALRGATPGFAGAYWVADWTGEPHEVPGALVVQWASPTVPAVGGPDGHFDLSTIYEAAPPPEPAPPQPEGGFDLATVPDIQEGSTGDVVKTWQSILNGRGEAALAVDGIFGSATKLKTQEWQDVFKLATDGIVGPQTWASAFA